MPKDDKKIENLEKSIQKNLGMEQDKSIEDIDEKINNFRHNFKSMSGNNIIEFMTKVMFDKDVNGVTGSIKPKGNNKREIQKMLEHEKWDKIFNMEKDRLSRYSEYEIIYSYIPELASCIDAYRDSIIAPDDLISDSLPIFIDDKLVTEQSAAMFEDNIENLEKKYRLKNLQKNIIRDTLKLGDQFVAVLKYEDEFQRYLLKEENDKIMLPKEFLNPELRKETAN